MKTFTTEQREAWDKLEGPGKYIVEGQVAYQYLCTRMKWLVSDPTDPKTVLIIGSERDRSRFFKHMSEMGVIDGVGWEPQFFCYPDYEYDPDKEPGETTHRSCWSSRDVEDHFCNFIRHAKVNEYHDVAAVLLLNESEQSLRYVDRLLKIPVWRGATLEKTIQLPVYICNFINDAETVAFEKEDKTPSSEKRTIEIEWGHEMKVEAVEWLVPEFIPANQCTAFSGEMDTRKSTLALDIAASGSTFAPWFMQTETEKEEVILDGKAYRIPIARRPLITLVAADEDTYSTTVLPRFIAAGGNASCLGCLKLEVKHEKQGPDGLEEWSTPLSFDGHLNLLAEQIRKINTTREWPVGLLICDPIINRFGNKNYNNTQDARDIMAGLKKLCEELKLTVINICHFNKTLGMTAKQKTAGSKALIEAHRMAWAFDLEEDDPQTTLIAPIKHNLLKEARSYKISTMDIGGYGVIKFLGYSEKTADDRIDEKESKDRGNRKELKKAILDVLKDGPLPAGQVCNQLQDMGVMRTIQRAAEQLVEEGKLRKSGNNRKNMVWQLATEADQPTFDEVTNVK